MCRTPRLLQDLITCDVYPQGTADPPGGAAPVATLSGIGSVSEGTMLTVTGPFAAPAALSSNMNYEVRFSRGHGGIGFGDEQHTMLLLKADPNPNPPPPFIYKFMCSSRLKNKGGTIPLPFNEAPPTPPDADDGPAKSRMIGSSAVLRQKN